MHVTQYASAVPMQVFNFLSKQRTIKYLSLHSTWQSMNGSRAFYFTYLINLNNYTDITTFSDTCPSI